MGKSLAPAVAPLEVIIRKDTTLAVRDHSMGEREFRVSRNELIDMLKARTGKKAEQAVVISADKSVRYEEVINVMDMLQQQNIQKIGLLTQAKGNLTRPIPTTTAYRRACSRCSCMRHFLACYTLASLGRISSLR